MIIEAVETIFPQIARQGESAKPPVKKRKKLSSGGGGSDEYFREMTEKAYSKQEHSTILDFSGQVVAVDDHI